MGLMVASQVACAVPLLQLYIEGADYDPVSETWITDQSSFDIWVIGNTGGGGSEGPLHDVTLVAAVEGGSLADLKLTPITTSEVDDPSKPANPIAANSGVGNHTILPKHGVYTNGVEWQDFLLGDMDLTDSPLGDATQGGFPLYEAGQSDAAQINAYHVEMTGSYQSLHFDAYAYYEKFDKRKQQTVKKLTNAPFSHDAASIIEISSPQTALLMLVGMAGLIGWKRRV